MSLKATGMSLFMLSFIPPPQATATKRHHRHLRFKPLGCWRTGIFHCRSLTVRISINQAGYPDIPISHHPSLSVTGLTVTSNLPSQTAGSRPFQQLLGMFRDIGSLLGSTKNAPLFRRKTHSRRESIRIQAQNNWDRDESVSQLD